MTKPRDTEVLTCYAPKDLAQWLKEQAYQQGISRSEAIRRILETAKGGNYSGNVL